MKKIIMAIMIVAFNGLLASCSADANEENMITNTKATEGDDGEVTPPPPPPPPLDEGN